MYVFNTAYGDAGRYMCKAKWTDDVMEIDSNKALLVPAGTSYLRHVYERRCVNYSILFVSCANVYPSIHRCKERLEGPLDDSIYMLRLLLDAPLQIAASIHHIT